MWFCFLDLVFFWGIMFLNFYLVMFKMIVKIVCDGVYFWVVVWGLRRFWKRWMRCWNVLSNVLRILREKLVNELIDSWCLLFLLFLISIDFLIGWWYFLIVVWIGFWFVVVMLVLMLEWICWKFVRFGCDGVDWLF